MDAFENYSQMYDFTKINIVNKYNSIKILNSGNREANYYYNSLQTILYELNC